MRGAQGSVHIEARTPHKQERHHTLAQNLKAMSLWVLLIIRCSTFTVLSDVGHITHTCTQHYIFVCLCLLRPKFGVHYNKCKISKKCRDHAPKSKCLWSKPF